jgi:hypothetical protein
LPTLICIKAAGAAPRFTACMPSTPLPIPPQLRETLREFERLHEQWRLASAAADVLEDRVCADAPPLDVLLQQRLAADRLHRQAMQLLRDTPL